MVEGFCRAKLDIRYNGIYDRVLPILIHGDAALAGQGIVYEVTQMMHLQGYNVGGAIHLVINNQIGFTTSWEDARSSTYCTSVAEVVQRLAERSADATRQISALVKAIQTDTQDAVAAMERSTQGVVEGAKLSDNAGTALSEIDRVSRQLAELIEQISVSASREAVSANEVAGNIQHIFAVTEQTGEGTRATANQVRELSRMAEELRQSVSRFKIA